MKLTIDLPDSHATTIITAAAEQHGYAEAKRKKDKRTPQQFVEAKLLEWVLSSARRHLLSTAAAKARAEAEKAVGF